jgi:hypothetical protein
LLAAAAGAYVGANLARTRQGWPCTHAPRALHQGADNLNGCYG